MNDPLTAEERVQFNVLQRKIVDHKKQISSDLQAFINFHFPTLYNTREDVFIVFSEHADTFISLLQPFATKEHK